MKESDSESKSKCRTVRRRENGRDRVYVYSREGPRGRDNTGKREGWEGEEYVWR